MQTCCVCGGLVHTCEKETTEDGDYLCPVHGDGCELHDGRWVCSDDCWEVAVKWFEPLIAVNAYGGKL